MRELLPVTAADFPALAEAHRADGHECLLPTQRLVKDGRTVGAMSIGAVCLVLPWFHTQLCKPKDTVCFIREAERMGAAHAPGGPLIVCVPFRVGSPFQKHHDRLGYQTAGQFELTFKRLR